MTNDRINNRRCRFAFDLVHKKLHPSEKKKFGSLRNCNGRVVSPVCERDLFIFSVGKDNCRPPPWGRIIVARWGRIVVAIHAVAALRGIGIGAGRRAARIGGSAVTATAPGGARPRPAVAWCRHRAGRRAAVGIGNGAAAVTAPGRAGRRAAAAARGSGGARPGSAGAPVPSPRRAARGRGWHRARWRHRAVSASAAARGARPRVCRLKIGRPSLN
jgi:hypothetical protein